MKKLLITLGVMAFIGFAAFSWVLGTYNGYVRGNETVDNNWAAVESQYQRRFDLIPGIVNATKGAMRQEQAVFGAIAEARTRYAGSAPNSDERVQAAGQMESALSRLLVVMENYPELRSNQTIQAMMDELAGTENRIQVARDRYNDQVRVWNVSVKTMPKGMLAALFGFDERAFFEAEEGSEKPVNTDLSL